MRKQAICNKEKGECEKCEQATEKNASERCERAEKDNEEFTGKKGNSKKRDAGVERGKRCNTVTRQVAFVNRKTMAPAGGESKGEGKRLARERLRKCTFASE